MKIHLPRTRGPRVVLVLFAVLVALAAALIFVNGRRVSGNTAGAPPGCEAKAVASRLEGVLLAISRGDPNVVDDFFGRERQAPFQWYSIEGSVARNWDDLSTYFEERHQNGEQLRLLKVRFNGWDEQRGLVHFGPILVQRTARDIDLEREGWEPLAEGKGAYHCATRAIIVLSMGMRDA